MKPRKGIGATTTVVIVVVVLVVVVVGYVLFTPPSPSPATAQTSSTSSAGPQVSYSTPGNNPVEVITVTGPVPPYPVGQFEVIISLMNVGESSITSLNATLGWVPPPGTSGGPVQYSFVFNFSSSNPLLPGGSVYTRSTFVGPTLEGGLHYPLVISGTLEDGTQFFFTENVLFSRFPL
jgi:hypothetical protein